MDIKIYASQEYVDNAIASSSGSGADLTNYYTKPEIDTLIEGNIPVPETATVGQTIQVSAVDENGRPTAWEVVDFPSGGGEAWDILMNTTAEEDVSQFESTAPPDGHTFDEYTEVVIFLFVKPNSGEFTTGIHASLDGNGAWSGRPNIDLCASGIKDTAQLGQLYMARIERTGFGWIPVFFGKSYNASSMNNGISHIIGNTVWNSVICTYSANSTPENMETIWWNEPITAVKIGGYQAVLGAGSKAIVYGKRRA